MVRVTSDETLYYGTDQQGTTVLMTDEAGVKVWTSEATPFGDAIVTKTGDRDDLALKYTGKDLDEDTGLYYYNARWYDAGTGRFISEDPARDGANWYIYTTNNPLKYIDPTGMSNVEDEMDNQGKSSDKKQSNESGSKDPAPDNDRDRNQKDKINERIGKLKGLEGANTLGSKLAASWHRQRLKEQLEQLARTGSDAARDWIKANTEINITRGGPYHLPGFNDYDGTLSVDFKGISLFKAGIHTWADREHGEDGGTVRAGMTFQGRLLSRSGAGKGKFLNPIWLTGNGINDAGILIHPDTLTGFGQTSPYTGGWSEGCFVMHLNNFNSMTEALQSLGFGYGNYGFGEVETDKITVNNRLNPDLENYVKNLNDSDVLKRNSIGYFP